MKDSAELPVTQQADGRLHVMAQVGSEGSADMVVDTGSPSTLLSDDEAFLSGFTLTDTSTYANVSGMHKVVSGVLARLGLGKFTETNVDCEIPVGEPNLLGSDLLSPIFLVTFDLINSKMYLTRSSDYTERTRSRGEDSMSIVQKDGWLQIASIVTGSAAAQAGIKRGDMLLSINGVDVRAMPLLSVHLLLNAYAGDKATLELVRHGESVHASYTVESAGTGSNSGSGVKVTMVRGGKLTVPDIAGGGRVTLVEPGQTVTITPGTTVLANPPHRVQ